MPVLLGLFLALAARAGAAQNVPFEPLGGDDCFMFSQETKVTPAGGRSVAMSLELVIDDAKRLAALFDEKVKRMSCASKDAASLIPKVDFSKKTVLGQFQSGACNDVLERKVTRDDERKEIVFTVTAVGRPMACMGPGPESLNLIAVPKIPRGYKVVFKNLRKDP